MSSSSYLWRVDVPDDVAGRICAIPGCWATPRWARAPLNAGWLVEQMLAAAELQPRLSESPDPVVAADPRDSEVHGWLWSAEPTTVDQPIRLLPYQRAAIDQLLAQGGGHLWAPAGSGKTVVGIVVALAGHRRPVIIATRSGARETQLREIKRCTSCVPFEIRPKHLQRKRDRWASLRDYLLWCRETATRPVVVIGYDALEASRHELIAMQPGAVVYDESHACKQPKRESWRLDRKGKLQSTRVVSRSSAAAALAEAIPRRYATTATPLRHRLWDLWGQLTLVEAGAWGRTATRFLLRYCDGKPGEYGGIDATGQSNTDELLARLAFSAIRVPYSVVAAQLPPKRRQVIRVATEDQVKALSGGRELAAERRRALKAGETDRKARRFLREARLHDAASAKRRAVIAAVRDYRDTGRGKILVFTGRHRDVEELGRQLDSSLKGVKVWAAHGGSHDVDARQAVQDEYMAHAGPCVLVGTIDAFGESRNLQDADVLMCVSLPYTPGQLDQMEGRAQRLGMDRPCLFLYIIAEGTIDERVCSLLLDKLPAVEAVVGRTATEGLAQTLSGLDKPEEIEATFGRMFDDIEFDVEEED